MVSMFCKCYLVYELVSSIKLEHSLLARTVNKYESFHLNTPLSTARTVASFGGNLAGSRVRYLQPRQFFGAKTDDPTELRIIHINTYRSYFDVLNS